VSGAAVVVGGGGGATSVLLLGGVIVGVGGKPEEAGVETLVGATYVAFYFY
jgi:hypothetical protein